MSRELTNMPGLFTAAVTESVLAAVLLCHVEKVDAATVAVTNCNDSGSGSLRRAVLAAASGDTIDMRGLTCETIALSSGEIALPQDDLTLLGRDPGALSIEGNQSARVFNHTGAGTLRISSISIAYGKHVAAEAEGGCVNSQGSVELRHVLVHHCVAQGIGTHGHSEGGGVRALASMLLNHTRIFSNSALSEGYGGGVLARDLTLYRSKLDGNVSGNIGGAAYCWLSCRIVTSVIHGNSAKSAGGFGGPATALIKASEISGNNATQNIGAVDAGFAREMLVVNSTISGNSAPYISALAVGPGNNSIVNSTIADNHELGLFGNPCQGGTIHAGNLYLESSIVAANSCATGPSLDLTVFPGPSISLTGANNLIGRSALRVPPDTLCGRPLLAPLANNGGVTRTHALLPGSPAIDHGSNPLDLLYDQRGAGYPRIRGPRADIGAYEY